MIAERRLYSCAGLLHSKVIKKYLSLILKIGERSFFAEKNLEIILTKTELHNRFLSRLQTI